MLNVIRNLARGLTPPPLCTILDILQRFCVCCVEGVIYGGREMHMKRIVIREAIPTDYSDIVTFYREHPDEHVMLRTPEAVTRAIENGVFFLAIDTEATNSGRICAASAVYDIEATLPSGGAISLKEAGGSNVRQEMRGFAIHKILHAARALHTYITDARGFHEYFGAIIVPNESSVKNIVRMGFVDWLDVPRSLRNERDSFATEGRKIRFFKFIPESLVASAQLILTFYNCSLLERRIDGQLEQVELVMDLELIRRYLPLLTTIADGDVSYFTLKG